MATKAIIDKAIKANPTVKPNRIRAALKPPKIAEADEQIRVMEWAHYAYRRNSNLYPMLRLLHASMNAGKRSLKQGARLKAQGLLKGVPDLFLPVAMHGKSGLFIELKIAPSKPTREQLAFIQDVKDQNYSAHVCYSAKEAIMVIQAYYGVIND